MMQASRCQEADRPQRRYTVDAGRILCPDCAAMGRRSVIAYVRPDSMGRAVVYLCRRCKTRHLIDIDGCSAWEHAEDPKIKNAKK